MANNVLNELNCSPDFNSFDFHPEDWHTSVDAFGIDFSIWIWERLPQYFVENDTYKDANGDGILMRYLSVLGYELDMDIVNQIPCYLKIIDPTTCAEEFLIHLSDVLGNPPDIFNDISLYRKLLNYIVAVYKIKGTVAAYELFFSLLGYDIAIVEIEPVNNESQYDIEGEYDTGNIDSVYDNNRCSPCSAYSITFYPQTLEGINITQSLLDRLRVAIDFNEPINAKLRDLTFAISFEDTLKLDMSDITDVDVQQTNSYDIGLLYDDDVPEEYDIAGIGNVFLESLITFTSTLNVSNQYEITCEILNNYAPEAVNIASSIFTVKGLNVAGDTIYQDVGPLINTSFPGGNLNGQVVSTYHVIPNPSSIQISGIIILTDGRAASIQSNISINGDTTISLFFI